MIDNENLTTEFALALDAFDMANNSSLVFVKDMDKHHNNSERLSLEIAQKYEATAVYFRRFPDGRSSIPQIFIYDYTSIDIDEDKKQRIASLHKDLWNLAYVPLFFVFYKTKVDIFNCHKEPKINKNTGTIEYTVFEEITLASIVDKKIKDLDFSAKMFDNGAFWDISNYSNDFSYDQSVYERLLKQLKHEKSKVVDNNILTKETAKKLFVMTILIKYLEERSDEEGNTVFPKGFFSQFDTNAKCFADILNANNGVCLEFFDFLSDHFNGKIFEWSDPEERSSLKKADLGRFADFVEGKREGEQYVFWSLYSFNHLPIELISNIYEDFLENKPGVVYTPPYLVNLLIDETIPLTSPEYNIKILDPACGSGVFLVAAYRRLVEIWRSQNDWKKPDLITLKKLLKENIYGCDLDKTAVRLAVFSLSLALCDMITPKVIWEELKFDNLFESNLLKDDYFKLINNGFFPDGFDLIIGNPPFKSKIDTEDAIKIESERRLKRPPIPDKQAALLFLDQSMFLCKDGGTVCLILPAGPLLYNENSFSYRNYLINNFIIPQIFDFSALNRVLFHSVNVSATALFIKNEKPKINEEQQNIKKPKKSYLYHVTIRRTKATTERLYFEIDYYDFHKVSCQEAITNRMIWKCNLLGGGRIKYLVERLCNTRTFGQYLKEKENEGWVVGEGYILGDENKRKYIKEYLEKENILSEIQREELERLLKIYKRADYITNKPSLSPDGLTEDGINTSEIYIQSEDYFIRNRSRDRKIFEAPHILIGEKAGKSSIPITLCSDYLTFTHQIIGIHAPKEREDELKNVEKRIKNNQLYLFYLAACSGRFMISKYTSILKKDIDKLPYPDNDKDISLSEIENILVSDVRENIFDYHNKGEKSKIFMNVTNNDLDKYANIYCTILNSVYKELKPDRPLETKSFICYPFFFKKKTDDIVLSNENIEQHLEQLITNNLHHANLRIIRRLTVYHENMIYIIKPKLLRYWLQSIAISDADETFQELLRQGY